jgi:hypothetical protein
MSICVRPGAGDAFLRKIGIESGRILKVVFSRGSIRVDVVVAAIEDAEHFDEVIAAGRQYGNVTTIIASVPVMPVPVIIELYFSQLAFEKVVASGG